MCDGAQALTPRQYFELFEQVKQIHSVSAEVMASKV
ncbi:MAG: hypothetical protein ACRD6X_21950 [Pyrinomonadaceae bacterium]